MISLIGWLYLTHLSIKKFMEFFVETFIQNVLNVQNVQNVYSKRPKNFTVIWVKTA